MLNWLALGGNPNRDAAASHSLMRSEYASRAAGSALALVVLLCTLSPGLSAFAQSQVEMIIQRSVEANERDWKADPEFNYFVRNVENGTTRTFQVMMIEGSPYYRLVEVNDQPLPPPEQEKEEQKLQQAIAQRKSETPSQRAARIAQYERDRNRDHLLMQELAKAFNFKLEGEQKLGPYEVYVLDATPRPGYAAPNRETRVLTGMKGRLWIDKKTYQWVRVEAQVIHPVSIEGFLARVEPGTQFELEKMPVTDSIWLPKHFAMKTNARVLGMFSHRRQEDDTYWGYQKAAPIPAATQALTTVR